VTRFVALFRGINVGGHHSLPMQDLRAILSGLGCNGVQTYIQSGNAVFEADADAATLAREIGASIGERFGFEPAVLLLDTARFRAIASENPFRDIVEEPKHLHVWFLAGTASNPDLDAINDLKADSERYDLTKHAFYLHAPDGIARSKLAAKVDRLLGVSATGRNLNTVNKLLALVDTVQ